MKKMISGASIAALATARLVGPGFLQTKDDDGGGATATPEIKSALDDLQKTVNDFREKNDERLTKLEKGGDTGEIDQKLNDINDLIKKQEDTIKDLQLKAKRPQMSSDGKKQLTEDQVAHKDAFGKFMRKGAEGDLGELQMKALQVGVDADGGYAVPEEIDRNIQALAQDISPIRAIATVISTSTSDYKKLVNKHGTGANWQGETGTTANSGTPALAEVTPPHGWLEARPRVTQMMLDDAFFNVEGWLSDEVAREFSIAEGSAFINGNGTDKPRGFLAGSAPLATDDATRAFGTLQFVAGGAAAAFPSDPDKLIDLVQKLKAAHRRGASFVANAATVGAMRKMKDSQGQYYWQPSLVAGQPATFLGYPIVEAEDMPDIATNAFPLAFGNFKAGYLITDRIGVRVQRDPYTAKPYVEFYTTKRVGGAVVDSEAIKLLKIAT